MNLSPSWAAGRAEHVFIISFDGGKPAVMKESQMPVLQSLLKKSAYTWHAQTIFPSLTLPSHTSMLTGVQPDKHHVLWNDWDPGQGQIPVPTIFSLAKQKKLSTAMFVGKEKLAHLNLPNSLNTYSMPAYECKQVAQTAADYILKNKPNLCFIHFADSDGAGHMYGWGSAQQKQAFASEDQALNTVLDAIDKAGIQDSSVIILSADHGGHDRTHGSNSAEDMNIPWIVSGKGVKPNPDLKNSVSTCDTAATALWLLDVPLPKNFDGKPVTEAFKQTSASR
jgi:predicted AlkP superfamily pyrophosphatase or phosphodiesterase